jgi:hypothetical protein
MLDRRRARRRNPHTGRIVSVALVDIQMQDTGYVVAHFHYVGWRVAVSPARRRLPLGAEMDGTHDSRTAGRISFPEFAHPDRRDLLSDGILRAGQP